MSSWLRLMLPALVAQCLACGGAHIDLSGPLEGDLQSAPANAGSGDTSMAPSTSVPPASGASCTSDRWGTFAESFFQNNCSSCHGTTFATDAAVVADGNVVAYLQADVMPPSGGLDPNTRARIITWLRCGGPQ